MGLGYGIRNPGSGKNLFRIPDPGAKKHPIPDPGSATLQFPCSWIRIRIPNSDPDLGLGQSNEYGSG
jgi:hypothetical protein